MIDYIKALTQITLALPGIVSAWQYIKGRAVIKAAGESDKPGWKTSEFWMALGLNILPAIAAALGK